MKHELRDHSAPYYQINRTDYHAMLHRLACTLPGATICDMRPDPVLAGGPSVTLASGEVFYADLIVGANGVKSTLQKAVTGLNHRATPTGSPAYRAVVSAGLMFEEPELGPLVDVLETIVWTAPGRHLGAYYIASMARQSVV